MSTLSDTPSFIRNKKYETVLNPCTYRLRDRNAVLRPDQMTTLSSTAALIRSRLEGYFFSGSPPLAVLPFLVQVARVANQTQLSEATLLWIFEDFLRAPAKEAFRLQGHDSWDSAVQWLLSSYAPEPLLDAAVRRLQAMHQGATETVRDFGLRLQTEASYLGTLAPLPELKALFGQGLRDPVGAHFSATQPAFELAESAPLSVLIWRAEILERGIDASTSGRARSPANPFRLALTLPSISEDGDQDEEISVLALDPAFTRDRNNRGLTCFVCFRVGHQWLDCPYLQHLSGEEKESCAYRRRSYYEKRKVQWKGSLDEKPGWETGEGRLRPTSSWREDPPRPSVNTETDSKNDPMSSRK
jgi:hypothetical protein